MKRRILIVDDEKEFAETLSERLTMRDFDTTISVSGEDAIEKIKGFIFDVVILDVSMPGKSGIDVLREIKKIKPLTEVIMLTGHATVETAIEGMKLGAHDYLIKPCETEELVTKINKAYSKKAEHEERIREARVREIISSPRSVLNQ
ncbi:MAG: response regulator [Deltaproteobacteria bacterium]|nr:response regulator [Deltaproteobacteria bacterium]